MCAKKKQNGFYNTKEDRVIYVLLFPAEKVFYINQCTKNAIKETYRHHLKGRRTSTKNFIQYNKILQPQLFILEELRDITKANAYGYVLVWLKILLENQYASYNAQATKDQSTELYFNNRRLYEERKDVRLEELFSEQNCVLPEK